MTPFTVPAKCNDDNQEESNSRKLHCVIVAIKHAKSINSLIDWLLFNPEFHQNKLELIHIVSPEWLEHEPVSGVGGLRMLANHETRIAQMSTMLESCKRKISLLFPLLSIEYRTVTGERLSLLTSFVENPRVNQLIVFSEKESVNWNIFQKSIVEKLIEKSPGKVIVLSGNDALKRREHQELGTRFKTQYGE